MSDIKNNIFAGITAAVVALPLALAFGVASGAGAIAGLYGAIILGFFAAVFGGTKTQISGPTGPMTVVTASAFVAFPGDINSVMFVIFLAGLIQISFAMVNLGRWIKYIPYPVISGFMSGVGIIIIILQINPFLGVESYGKILFTLSKIPETISMANIQAFTIASITLAIMFFTPKKVSKIVPSALIALVAVTLFSYHAQYDVKTIGEIPMGFPDFTLPFSFDLMQADTIIMLSITLALLGSIDSLLTSLVADSITKTKHNSNKELYGQGIGNAVCSFFGAIPGAGATMRTVININSGGTNMISGIVHSITLLLIVLVLAPFAQHIPLPVLAGILVKVGLEILDYRFFKIIGKINKNELVIMMTVLLLTVFVDLIMAVGAGITIASILAVYQLSKNTRIKTKPKSSTFDIEIDNIDIEVIRIDGSLFFGTISMLEEKLDNIATRKYVIFDCKKVTFLDLSALLTLQEIIEKLHERNIKVILVMKYRHKRKLQNIQNKVNFPNVKIYNNIDDAVNRVQEKNYDNAKNISSK